MQIDAQDSSYPSTQIVSSPSLSTDQTEATFAFEANGNSTIEVITNNALDNAEL